MTRCPVTIRGVTYPSITAAAAALGVNRSTISLALDRGTVDGVGATKLPHARISIVVPAAKEKAVRAAIAAEIARP